MFFGEPHNFFINYLTIFLSWTHSKLDYKEEETRKIYEFFLKNLQKKNDDNISILQFKYFISTNFMSIFFFDNM